MSYMLKTNASDKRTVMQNNDMQNTKMYICEKSTKKKKKIFKLLQIEQKPNDWKCLK